MPTPEVPKAPDTPKTLDQIKADVEQKLTALKAEIDGKKDKGEKLGKEDITKYRAGIKELKNAKTLSSDQEEIVKGIEDWLNANEKMSGEQTDGKLDAWRGKANTYLSFAKGYGSWMLKQLADLCEDKGMLGVFKKLLVGLSHSKEAEIAGLNTIAALKDLPDARLEDIRTTLNQKAAEIAKARTARGAGLPEYDLVSLIDEVGKDSITDDKALLARVDDLAKTENTNAENFQKAKAAQAASGVPPPAKS